MKPRHAAILGLGLIGGSLALALKEAWPEIAIAAWDRDPDALRVGVDRGAIDHAEREPRSAVEDADLVVVATPVGAIEGLLGAIADALPPTAVVTDVASTKRRVCDWARDRLRPGAFVGGHPMAGSERHGIAHASADLFRGATYCIVPGDAPASAVRAVEAIAEAIGAKPFIMSAEAHDEAVAAASHLPFLVSAALARVVMSDERWEAHRAIAAGGFRDVTRLASGDVTMHRDICLTNADAIAPWLRAMADELLAIADRLEDPLALDAFFEAAKSSRDAWMRDR